MDYSEMLEDEIIEEEVHIMNYLAPVKRPYTIRPRPQHIDDWDDVDFVRRFRLSKASVGWILDKIYAKLRHRTDRNHVVSPMQQLLVTLRFYATGSFYIAVGDFSGIHKSTAGKIVRRITSAIAQLRPEFITFPNNRTEIVKLQQEFYNIARFPRVIGAMDCTHVRIMSPGGDTAENFRNRKGYFSLNVQAICDAKLKLIDVVARWPGSSHDSTIFDNSAARAKFESGSMGNALILGDSGYPLRNYSVTPIGEPSNIAENLFNESQIRTRNVIERCFGVWKRRFPVISVAMRCRLPLVQDNIIATAVLHSIARTRNEAEPPIIINFDGNEDDDDDASYFCPENAVDSIRIRMRLIEYFREL